MFVEAQETKPRTRLLFLRGKARQRLLYYLRRILSNTRRSSSDRQEKRSVNGPRNMKGICNCNDTMCSDNG